MRIKNIQYIYRRDKKFPKMYLTTLIYFIYYNFSNNFARVLYTAANQKVFIKILSRLNIKYLNIKKVCKESWK